MPRLLFLRRTPVTLTLLAMMLAGSARADWSGFGSYDAIIELGIDRGAIELGIRIREDVALRLAQVHLEPATVATPLLHVATDGDTLSASLPTLPEVLAASMTQASARVPAFREIRRVWPLHMLPRALHIAPGEAGGIRLGLVLSHRGIPLADPSALDTPQAASLDWVDPWRSHFADADRVRRHTQPKSYLYVEPTEIRHEVLIRLSELRPGIGVAAPDSADIPLAERRNLLKNAGEFLQKHNPLTVNGTELPLRVDKAEFLHFTREGLRPVADDEPLAESTALVGAILSARTQNPTTQVALVWDLFVDPSSWRGVILHYAGQSFDHDLTATHPEFTWSIEEALPPAEDPKPALQPVPDFAASDTQRVTTWAWVGAAILALGLLLAGARWSALCVAGVSVLVLAWTVHKGRPGSPFAEQAETASPALGAHMESTLRNIYQAWAVPGEEAAYDRLALSLDGPLLEEMYLNQRRAILARQSGLGGEGRVARIELTPDYGMLRGTGPHQAEWIGRWIAHGTVAHWGHEHERHSIYASRLSLAADEKSGGTPKIIDIDLYDGRAAPGGAP